MSVERQIEKELRKALVEIALELADEIEDRAKKNIKTMNIEATGLLSASFEKDIDDEGVTVGNVAPYGGFVDTGTRPHRIPPYVLHRWVAVKLRKVGEDVIRTAFAVANKIAKYGTEAKPYFSKAVWDTIFAHEGKEEGE